MPDGPLACAACPTRSACRLPHDCRIRMNADRLNRRSMLRQGLGGFGGIALAEMLGRDDASAAFLRHHPPKAKRVVQLFMAGAASHVDTFDYKPELEKRHGRPWDPGETVELFQSQPGACFASPWKFRPYGDVGKFLSDAVAPLGDVVDQIAFIHNLVGKTGVHSQGTLLQTTGFNLPGIPQCGFVGFVRARKRE